VSATVVGTVSSTLGAVVEVVVAAAAAAGEGLGGSKMVQLVAGAH
jgi:hypothetical protein